MCVGLITAKAVDKPVPRRFIGGVTAGFTEWNRPIATCNQIGGKSPQSGISRFGPDFWDRDASQTMPPIPGTPSINFQRWVCLPRMTGFQQT